MTSQLTFDDLPHDPTLREKAQQWMDEHPLTMGLFRRFANELLAKRARFSVRLLSERVRWQYMTDADLSRDDFKINDHFTPYVARALIHEQPVLGELIECRVTKRADDTYRAPAKLRRVDPLTEEPLGGDQ